LDIGKVYKNLDISQKTKYIEMYWKEREEYNKKMKALKNYVFELPKIPKTVFLLFLEDKWKENKENNNKLKSKGKLLEFYAKEFKDNEKLYIAQYQEKTNLEMENYLMVLYFTDCYINIRNNNLNGNI
jgi:hypothetical protein